MCGISFILSKKEENIINYLLNSLQLIQNRGYDSIGICYFDENYKIEKNASTFNNDCFEIIKEKFLNNCINSYIGLGHTRWATHGGKTDNNAHPHISNKNNIILVHNGIINNFNILKQKLISFNYNFYSDTDSEVIANLIEYYLINEGYSIENSIEKCINDLEGTWALVIIYTKENENFYITRKGSPLLLGVNENYLICTSEVNGFVGLVNDYIPLNDNNIIKIDKQKYEIIDNLYINNNNNNNNNNINNIGNFNKINNNDIINSCAPYNHWLIKEIMEQKETIQKAYNFGGRIENNVIKLGGLDQISNIICYIEHIVLIGCGTSYNAALIGEKYFKTNKNFVSVTTINACEFIEDDIPNIENKAKILTIFLSQSGETLDVYNCLKICKKIGTITLGVINKVDSLISREVMCGVYLNCGSEISVASTKSFSSMIIVLSLIDIWFSQKKNNNNFKNIEKLDNLRFLSNTVNNLLFDTKFIESIDILIDFIINNNINNIFILGKNKLSSVAYEGSLKIKEVTYLHCEGFSSGSLKHGPFALLDSNNLTLLLIDYSDITNYQNLKSTYYEILGRETNLFVITNSIYVINELQINNYVLIYKLNFYNEIIFSITLQYLAYYLSLAKNINPDKPRNLAKVVTVE